MKRKIDIYGGRDPREIPTYGIAESAHWLQIPQPTLRSWIRGRYYPTSTDSAKFEPVILLPDRNLPLLSFINLVEAHILDAIRYRHNIPLKNVRSAVSYLRQHSNSTHPLADYWFQIKGLDLLVEESGLLVNATRKGQIEMKEIISAYLERVERDPQGAAARLYPYLSRHPEEVEGQPKLVLIDPRISFGKPILVGVGVPTAVIADRYSAGESIRELAKDYGCEASEIEKAIQYEHAQRKAA
jgi:uncharacterized protein (DUF433 family)